LQCFPKDFLWGATISAHGTEGGDFNSDWWRWEQRPSRIQHAATSKEAADHYSRYREDAALAQKLGMNSVLVGLSWARIQPGPDFFDEEALAHYRSVFESMRACGLMPIGALQEIALPDWFAQRGGWENGAAAKCFEEYAGTVAQSLGGICRWWIPILEPAHWHVMAYREKSWPAPRKAFGGWLALRQIALAQAAAFTAIHCACPGGQVGISVRAGRFAPENAYSAWDLRAARAEQRRQIHGFPLLAQRFGGDTRPFDFLAASYYGRHFIRFAPFRPAGLFARCVRQDGAPASPEQAAPYPAGLIEALEELRAYRAPILIAGNGLATGDDANRAAFLLDHVAALENALRNGVEIKGYFHRALLDGFEWNRGYAARYGLVHVDRNTLTRTPNASAYLFRGIAEQGGIRIGTAARFCPDWKPPEELA